MRNSKGMETRDVKLWMLRSLPHGNCCPPLFSAPSTLSSSNLYVSASKHEDGTKPGQKDQMVVSG